MNLKSKNPRAKKLNAIATKIVNFIVLETFDDEQETQNLLSSAIDFIDKAVDKCIADDEKAQKKG